MEIPKIHRIRIKSWLYKFIELWADEISPRRRISRHRKSFWGGEVSTWDSQLCAAGCPLTEAAKGGIHAEYWLSWVLHIKSRARPMARCRVTWDCPPGGEGASIFVVGVSKLGGLVIRLKARLYDSLEEVRSELTFVRQGQNRMEHPLWHARLLEVGEPEGPAGIGGIDYVADAEGQRLSPHRYLVADVGG